MRPELRGLSSPDLLDMRSSMPDEPDDFCILVEALIGPVDGPGAESFGFLVCTPRWLSREVVARSRVTFGKHYLFVAHYDYDILWGSISLLCQRIRGATWREVAERLSKYGRWEFEDSRESP